MQVNYNYKAGNSWIGTGTGTSSVTVAKLAKYIKEAKDKSNHLKTYGKHSKRGNDVYLTYLDGANRDVYMLTDDEMKELLPLIK